MLKTPLHALNVWVNKNTKLLAVYNIIIFSLIVFLAVLYRSKTLHSTTEKAPLVTPSPSPTLPPEKRMEWDTFKIFEPAEWSKSAPTSTIKGKMYQSQSSLLPYEFGNITSPVDGQEHLALTFKPGKIKNATFLLNGKKLTAFGFPQYPYVFCDYQSENGVIVKYDTAEQCLVEKQSELPPVIFFIKLPVPLDNGQHELKMIRDEKEAHVTFFIEPELSPAPVDTFFVDNRMPGWQISKMLDKQDICSAGYYYPTNYLPIPLVTAPVPTLYGISFPQSERDVKTVSNGLAHIKIEKEIFTLKLPPHDIFYFNSERINDTNGNTGISALKQLKQLYIPQDILVNQSGVPINIWQGPSTMYASAHYLEVVPLNSVGQPYLNGIIPWQTSNSSGCDG